MSPPNPEALALVNAQAADGGLWFMAQTAPEAYLQAALRRLHAAVERDALTAHPECHPAALCDGPEQARIHAEHLALCAEAQAKAMRERLQLEDRVARQAREIQTWKDLGEKEHALAVQFAKERDAQGGTG